MALTECASGNAHQILGATARGEVIAQRMNPEMKGRCMEAIGLAAKEPDDFVSVLRCEEF